MRHYIGQLSLIHGWLPMLAQVGTAAVLSYAVYRRSRLIPVIAGLAMGVVLAALAYWYLDALGVAGEPRRRGCGSGSPASGCRPG